MLPKAIAEKVSKEFHLSKQEVNTLYTLWWQEVKELITSVDVLNIGEPTDVNIPFIGKLIFSTQKLKHKNHGNYSKENKTSE